MIKAMGTGTNGRKFLLLGLSFRNLDKFKAKPGDTFINIWKEELGINFDIIICSGETEEKLAAMLNISPDTIINVSKDHQQN